MSEYILNWSVFSFKFSDNKLYFFTKQSPKEMEVISENRRRKERPNNGTHRPSNDGTGDRNAGPCSCSSQSSRTRAGCLVEEAGESVGLEAVLVRLPVLGMNDKEYADYVCVRFQVQDPHVEHSIVAAGVEGIGWVGVVADGIGHENLDPVAVWSLVFALLVLLAVSRQMPGHLRPLYRLRWPTAGLVGQRDVGQFQLCEHFVGIMDRHAENIRFDFWLNGFPLKTWYPLKYTAAIYVGLDVFQVWKWQQG